MRRGKRGHRAGPRFLEIAILIGLPILLHYLIPVTIVVPRPYSYLGAVLMLLGFALMTWAADLFHRAGAGFQLNRESSVLVTSGPFRFSRNPMYLGMLIWLIGMAVLLGTLITFLFPVLFFLVANFFIIPLEERSMEQQFGDRYLDYKQRVRRWL
ncbi:MAG: hypothetical protein XD63_0811 [Thermoanaerobacterales bacterium 50_218]|nr:MAG: hypothetical protein XD63_0811 [Thermoanaerobacterales bacterium 50_218]